MALNVCNKELVVRDIVSSANAKIDILQQRVVIEISQAASSCIQGSCSVIDLGVLDSPQNNTSDFIHLAEPGCIEPEDNSRCCCIGEGW